MKTTIKIFFVALIALSSFGVRSSERELYQSAQGVTDFTWQSKEYRIWSQPTPVRRAMQIASRNNNAWQVDNLGSTKVIHHLDQPALANQNQNSSKATFEARKAAAEEQVQVTLAKFIQLQTMPSSADSREKLEKVLDELMCSTVQHLDRHTIDPKEALIETHLGLARLHEDVGSRTAEIEDAQLRKKLTALGLRYKEVEDHVEKVQLVRLGEKEQKIEEDKKNKRATKRVRIRPNNSGNSAYKTDRQGFRPRISQLNHSQNRKK